MIEVDRIARPRPTAHSDSGGICRVVENTAAIAEQRISHRVLLIKGPYFFRGFFLKYLLRRDALSSCRPHIADVQIFRAVVIEVEPGDAHPRANGFRCGLRGNIGEGSVASVAVQSLAAKIIYDIEIGPAIAVVVTPSTTKAVTRVF